MENFFLFCPFCRERFSANLSDYFWLPAYDEIQCGNCQTPLLLASAHEVITIHLQEPVTLASIKQFRLQDTHK